MDIVEKAEKFVSELPSDLDIRIALLDEAIGKVAAIDKALSPKDSLQEKEKAPKVNYFQAFGGLLKGTRFKLSTKDESLKAFKGEVYTKVTNAWCRKPNGDFKAMSPELDVLVQ